MIIAQISDTHLIVDGPGSARRIADFKAVVQDINALDPSPDVIVHTGDVAHNGTPEEYTTASEILGEARAPVYVLAGNKDNRANLRDAFSDRGYLPSDTDFITYAVEDLPIRLLMLDTVNPDSKKGAFCPARMALADHLLARDKPKPIAVFMHHPPFEVLVGPERYHFDDLAVMEGLTSALYSHDGIAGIFCGHVHRLTSGRVGAVPAAVMSAVATQLRYGDYPAEVGDRPIYFLHHFDPQGGFRTDLRIAGAGAVPFDQADYGGRLSTGKIA